MWTNNTHPSHLAIHRFESINQIAPKALHNSRPSSQILCSRHFSISSISNCDSCGREEIVRVAWDRCATKEDGEVKVKRRVCLESVKQNEVKTCYHNIPVINPYDSLSSYCFNPAITKD